MSLRIHFKSDYRSTTHPEALLKYNSQDLHKFANCTRTQIYRKICELAVGHNLQSERPIRLKVELAYPRILKTYLLSPIVGSAHFRSALLKTLVIAGAVLLNLVALKELTASLGFLQLLAPLAFSSLLYSFQALTNKLKIIGKIIEKVDAEFDDIRQSIGIRVTKKPKQLDPSTFSVLKNSKTADSFEEPFTKKWLPNGMLNNPKIVVVDGEAFDAVRLLRYMLFQPILNDNTLDRTWTKVQPEYVHSNPCLKELGKLFLIKTQAFRYLFGDLNQYEQKFIQRNPYRHLDENPCVSRDWGFLLRHKLRLDFWRDSLQVPSQSYGESSMEPPLIQEFASRLIAIMQALPEYVITSLLFESSNNSQRAVITEVLHQLQSCNHY